MSLKPIKIFVQNHAITVESHKKKNEQLSDSDIHQLLTLPEDKIVCHHLPEKLLAELCTKYKFLEAAGGVVVSKHNHHWLMIYRRGYWDLPKGKIDEGEHPFATAKRELFEETGIIVDDVASVFLDVTYHFYKQNDQVVLKRTYWYMFFVEDKPALKLQHEEDIEKAEWVGEHNWPMIRQNTYASIIHILEQTNLV